VTRAAGHGEQSEAISCHCESRSGACGATGAVGTYAPKSALWTTPLFGVAIRHRKAMPRVPPWLLIRVLIFLLVIPGTVLCYIPAFLLFKTGTPWLPEIDSPMVAFIIPGLAGLAIVLACVRDFAVYGRGTPAPVDPPKVLVVRGLYRYMRNPMYTGVVTVLLSEAGLYLSATLLVYAVVVFSGFHAFVVLHEEPHLRKVFGAGYESYCSAIPRWGVRFRPMS